MNLDSQLVLGIVLIVVGIALGLLAYAFVLNRREREEESPVPAAEGATAPVEDGTAGAPTSAPEPVHPAAAPSSAVPPAPAVGSPTPLEAEPIASPMEAPSPRREPPPAAPTPPLAVGPIRRTYPIATLLRDEVTGKLVVQVGGRDFASAADLRASKDWQRVEFASADLVKWLGAAPSRERAGEPAKEEPRKPRSMIDQINEILERKMAASAGGIRGVRLVEGPGGSVRVFVGVQSYNFDEVPDADVRQFIREAVAEWETQQ